MKGFITIVALLNLAAFAELPQSLDQVLFGICGGTNYVDYVEWMKADGTLAFHKPFVIFDRAQFQMHYPTNDFAPRHYSIEMECEFSNVTSSTNLVNYIQKAECILLKSFKGRTFKRRYDGVHYQSSCADIDGLGWDACFYVLPLQRDGKISYVAKAKFYNSLHRAGRFVSCEDFDVCEYRQGNGTAMYAAHYAQRGYCRLGLAGYGRFLDYSFGRTNTCDSAAFDLQEGQDRFLCVTNSVVPDYKHFDGITLYHDVNSRRLFRIKAFRMLPAGASDSDCIRLIRTLSKDFDYWYKIKVPVPRAADIMALKSGHLGKAWAREFGDGLFAIRLSIALIERDLMRVEMEIESKKVRAPSVIQSDDIDEIEVKVDGL